MRVLIDADILGRSLGGEVSRTGRRPRHPHPAQRLRAPHRLAGIIRRGAFAAHGIEVRRRRRNTGSESGT